MSICVRDSTGSKQGVGMGQTARTQNCVLHRAARARARAAGRFKSTVLVGEGRPFVNIRSTENGSCKGAAP